MGASMERRDCTNIKIQILTTLYVKGQAGVYSGQLDGLVYEIRTNPRTLKKALQDLERKGLIAFDVISIDQKRVKIARITELGRQQTMASIQLLTKL
ncbi:MAG: hypothetical protein ABC596_09675 [Candidatus Methanosuratincola petrocarbonis]